MAERPETSYARSGEAQIGYQVVGQGSFDLVLLDQWFSNVDALWDFAPLARFVERMSTFARVIVLDKRGTGISDPVPNGGRPTLEAWMDDVRAVMDAAGSERAAFVSGLGACYLGLLFAATYPARTSALVLVDGYARLTGTDDYFPELPRSLADVDVEPIRSAWGRGGFLRAMAPAEYRNPATLRSFARYERLSASPATAFAVGSVLYERGRVRPGEGPRTQHRPSGPSLTTLTTGREARCAGSAGARARRPRPPRPSRPEDRDGPGRGSRAAPAPGRRERPRSGPRPGSVPPPGRRRRLLGRRG
ncbi:MAG TPA: alpha/beta hydrolase [Nocardioides sp.]|uniref:alpha/beta fold hydrolase n=1 Tax=Nocardioides sp. TaxID=35761 RepID=UPI002F410DC8